MPRKVSTASTWWPTWRNALATCAPLAIETSRSELLPPKRTAIFIVGIGINRFEESKEHVSNGRDCSDEKGSKQEKKICGGETRMRAAAGNRLTLARKNHVNPGATGSLRARRLLNSRSAS